MNRAKLIFGVTTVLIVSLLSFPVAAGAQVDDDSSVAEVVSDLKSKTASLSLFDVRMMRLNITRAHNAGSNGLAPSPVWYDAEAGVFRTHFLVNRNFASAEKKLRTFESAANGAAVLISQRILRERGLTDAIVVKFIEFRKSERQFYLVGLFEDNEISLVDREAKSFNQALN
jgi:hypothetical protein